MSTPEGDQAGISPGTEQQSPMRVFAIEAAAQLDTRVDRIKDPLYRETAKAVGLVILIGINTAIDIVESFRE